MRAHEFVTEAHVGTIGKRKQQATKGLHKFRDPNFADRFYELNRVMMAAASTDGTFVPEMDGESWIGRYNLSAPYTQQEHDMLVKAYKAVGSTYTDLNHGDLRSQEVDEIVNKKSPVQGFRGFGKK
jgi:hypothetical protein